ncbi:hypothetical protein HDU79_011140 [Rhizoclosmatium sp. JEL0117]|nr:hypothetical protein HDU79_011140 [Rhizoclosmatium sp. JEL0117]
MSNNSALQSIAPTEIVQAIFEHIHPTKVLYLKRLCRHVNECLSDPHFAVLNIRRHIKSVTRIESFSPTKTDKSWFHWPYSYQHAYINSTMSSLVSISWFAKIDGKIPESIGTLHNLQYLNLNGNFLHGGIPAEIGCLVLLKEFSIRNNQLSGPIPQEIGYLVNLVHLDLSRNRLGGCIPMEIGHLTSLESLCLGRNELEGQIPREFGKLSKLRDLMLDGNRLSGIILAELEGLEELEQVLLGGNEFDSVPSLFNVLPNLKKWNISK